MKRIFLSALPAILPLSAYADLPLTIEDMMTDKGKWKLETSITYLNSENNRAELAAPVYIQTGATSFIPIPTEIQENGSNTLSDGIRYKSGNYLLLNPNISFAANDRISLTGGIQWLSRQPDRTAKREYSGNTSTYAHFGAGFGFTQTTALNASARFNVSWQSSSELKFGVQHTF